tara:strand:+ start:425 stop:988 length:564 start_codon:yes stop_codon:yes gene_type:complete
MRIIAGKFKGKKLIEPSDKKTRPLKDLVKESLFNVIKHSNKFSIDLENSNVLDLFAGVGSFGLEALSRGAKQVIFVDSYSNVLNILEKNITNLNLEKRSNILKDDLLNDFSFNKLNQKFDIIYLDPPFKEKNIIQLILKIKDSKILKSKGIIILHRHKNENDNFSNVLKIIEEKKYGISKIIFLSQF